MNSTLTQVWNQLTKFNESPILNGAKTTASAVQSKAGKATVTATIVVRSTALATGVIPVNVKVARLQYKNVYNAEAGCREIIRPRQTWWGFYTYLNECAANRLARDFAVSAAGFGAASKIPYLGAGMAVGGVYLGVASNQLAYCADNFGQAYMRHYGQVWYKPIVPQQIVCK